MQIKERAHNTDMKIVVSEMSEWVSEWVSESVTI